MTEVVSRSRPGEFVFPTTPKAVVLVQFDRLKAAFLVQRDQRDGLNVQQSVKVRMVDTEELIPGTVEYISPITDGESGTIIGRVLIDNRSGKYRSGAQCFLRGDP